MPALGAGIHGRFLSVLNLQ